MPTGKANPPAMYGIMRGPSGWRVQLKRERVTLFKHFGYSTLGGKKSALARAQAWRDEMVRKHPPVAREQLAKELRSNNKSGTSGVSCTIGPDGKPAKWVAETGLGGGQRLRKSFTVGRYGAEAKLLAIAERQKQLERMSGLLRVHPAEAAIRASRPRPLPANCPPPIDSAELLRSTNKSGIPGVGRRVRGPGPGWWIARTRLGNGRYVEKSFAIRVHGEKKAKALAVAERQRQLQQKRKGRSARR
jgi:hypothetical protein